MKTTTLVIYIIVSIIMTLAAFGSFGLLIYSLYIWKTTYLKFLLISLVTWFVFSVLQTRIEKTK